MAFQRSISTCYPTFRFAARVFEHLSLKDRAYLIKACQGQYDPADPRPSVLRRLMDYPVIVPLPRSGLTTIPLYETFTHIGKSPNEPLQSAIMIDLLRGTPASPIDFANYTQEGWVKEIVLSETRNTCQVDYTYFFDITMNTPAHPLLPHNPVSRAQIFNRFRTLRENLIRYKPLHFARFTHKNMSDSTRHHFSRSTGIDMSEGAPIFGQDDWIRHYHDTGEELEGDIEMRQKWYPSNAKPRTYFAQGGMAYSKSRFLQDFFTTLVNYFPSTNHITRLQPHRLRVTKTGDEDGHYLVYDLSSFTSNMQGQRDFCRALRDYFKMVEVEIFDERYGVLTYTMGELLDEYNEHCVNHPVLSQNRVPKDLRTNDQPYAHECASMLGVYGNLMTCTLAHFLTVSVTVEDPFAENNTAGDDGLALFFLYTYFSLVIAISLVGVFALDKTYISNEPGAVCLKRPLEEIPGGRTDLSLKPNIVPPNLMVITCYLYGHEIDPRYKLFYDGDEEITPDQAISVAGKDLMRFLDSAHFLLYETPLLHSVYNGFTSLIQSMFQHRPYPGGSIDGKKYVWPVDPGTYAFQLHDPYLVYAMVTTQDMELFDRREDLPIAPSSLCVEGTTLVGNQNKWIKHMVMLGYIGKEEEKEVLQGQAVVTRLYMLFRKKSLLDPVVYRFTVNRDIPSYLVI